MLVEGLLVDALLLFLLLLLHVVVDLFLLGVEDSETVFKSHVSLQFVMLAEKLRVCLLTAKFKSCNIDALETFLK